MDNELYEQFISIVGIDKAELCTSELKGDKIVINQLKKYIELKKLEEDMKVAESRTDIYKAEKKPRKTLYRIMEESEHDPKKRKK